MTRGGAMRSLLLFVIGVLVGANAVYFLMVRAERCDCDAPREALGPVQVAPTPTKVEDEPASPATVPERPAAPTRRTSPPAADAPIEVVPAPATSTRDVAGGLVVPVQGIAAADLMDTYDDPRGSNRVHEALDIMAERGTPVLAATDGRIEKIFESDQGGHTIYEFDRDATHAYYYAHLDRYAPGIKEGKQVERGEVIGYVGSTGNANEDAPHLHFAIFELGPQAKWWEGTAIDPFPLLATPPRAGLGRTTGNEAQSSADR